MMEINIRPADNSQNVKEQNNPQRPVRMTLKQYLQSTNLRRRINSRSKSKSKKQLLNPISQGQPKLLQLPQGLNRTIQYFKLNQQWKSRKQFTSWILQLKQLCRQYIQRDDQYIKVIRLIQKIAEFVKTQIQTIKKDNLLLESYLVTEASYWAGDASNAEQDPANNQRISNYLKNVFYAKSQNVTSPDRSQLIDNQTRSPTINQPKESYIKSKSDTPNQPKTVSHPISQNFINAPSSSTTFKISDFKMLKEGRRSQLQRQAYSQKYKTILNKSNNYVGVGSLDRKIKNQQQTTRPHQPNSKHVKLQKEATFRESRETNKINFRKDTKLHSKKQEQLSLISVYDQKQTRPTQTQTQCSHVKYSKGEITRVTPAGFSPLSNTSDIPINSTHQNKTVDESLSLRMRKQKVQKMSTKSPDDFKMVVLDGDDQLDYVTNNPNFQQQTITKFQFTETNQVNQGQRSISNNKKAGMGTKINSKVENGEFQTSPLITRKSPNPFSIQTPLNLDQSPSPQEFTLPQHQQYIKDVLKDPQTKEKSSRQKYLFSRSPTILAENNHQRRSSRQNATKKYEQIRKDY